MRTTRRLVTDSYDRAASAFAIAADELVYSRLAAPLVDAVRGRLGHRPGFVLDVAAGSGAVGRHFERCVAVDMSVAQLRANSSPQRVQADGQHLPFADASFVAAVSGFGINHVLNPTMLIEEMARVGPVVGVSTWELPQAAHRPKQVVFDALSRRMGHHRSHVGVVLDRLGAAVGSTEAVARVLRSARVEGSVEVVEVEVPWLGIEPYLDYRLSMPTVAALHDEAGLRDELREALAALPADDLVWRPRIIVAVGAR